MSQEDTVHDAAEMLNNHRGGWNNAMGLRFTRATADEVIAEFVVTEIHLQPYGIVHGGVHCGVIETVCSTGAAVYAMSMGKTVVGLENSTSFLRAARGGTLRVTARPVTRGRTSQVWEASVHDDQGRILSTGRVRLLCLDPGADIAGKVAGLETPTP